MASRERDDAMAGLLKRSLAGDAGAGNACPAPDILAAYYERSLPADEIAHWEVHFSQCARCREQLAALARAEAEAPPASITDARRKAPRASWLWDWRWLAPVAAVLILTAVWATRRTTLTQIAEQPTPASAVAAPPQPAVPPMSLSRVAPAAPAAAPERVPAPSPEGKKQVPSRVVPAPALVSPPPKPPSLKESVAVNSADREKAVEVENAPPQNLQSPNSLTNLPLNNRNYTELHSVRKAAPAGPRQSADQAPNAAPSATTESVTVEAEAAPVATTPPAPSPALTPPKAGAAGIAGGVVASAADNAKQERAAMKGQDFAEVITTQQSTEEQRSGSFVVETPDRSVLWRVGSAGFVERSTDGGATWKGALPNRHARYLAGSAPSTKLCWLVGDGGIILLTQDGSHWRTIPPPAQTDLVAVTATDAWNATVTTSDGRKFTTSNQGKTWTAAQ